MQKTGKFAAKCAALLFVFSAGWFCAYSQSTPEIEATVSNSRVFVGEQVQLSISVSGSFSNLSRPELPDIPGFRLLSNIPSTQESYQYLNGRYSASYTYIYNLVARDEGTHRIPAIPVNIDGTRYQTDPITVDIVKQDVSTPGGGTRSEVFLKMEVSDKTPVPGQQLLASVYLYFKDGLEVSSYQPVPGWKAEGFWKEELQSTGRPQAEDVILNGVRYNRARLLQFALFPTKTGQLTISPYEIIISVRSMSSRNDAFGGLFGSFGGNQRQVEVQSDAVTLDVKELPPQRGINYIGAVGTFSIRRTMDAEKVYVGETVEIETVVNGRGNVPLVGRPKYELPEGLEIYEPRESSSINRLNQRISGAKIFTDIIVPRSPGSYTIPAEELAYFDPRRNRYVTERLPAITFTAVRNPNAVQGGDNPLSLNVKPVMGLVQWQEASGASGIASRWWFWAGILLPALIFGLALWQKSYRDKLSNDSIFARTVRADDTASDRLDKALEHADEGNIKHAYNALQKALTGYIGDKLGLPEAGLSVNQYIAALENHNVDPELVKNIRMLLDKCETISFAPDASNAYLKSHVGLAQSIIEKLKKEL